MKTNYIIFLLFLCFGSASAQSYEIESIITSDTINKVDIKGYKVGKWVIRGKHKLKPEHLTFPMEQIVETGNYLNNRKDGVWIEYYKNGKMRNKLTYVNGILNGPAAFYNEKEVVLKEGSFKDNKWVQ